MAKADTIIEVIKNSTVIPSEQFLPFIKQISEILSQATELYKTAQYNQNIAKILTERIIAANSFVNILYLREDIFNSYYCISLQRLVQVLINMKNYIKEITQYNTVQKFLEPKMIEMIEKKFKDLCKEYDSSINVLNFNLPVNNVKFNAQEEQKILKDDITELLKFQEVLIESMDGKISDANVHMSVVIEQVSEVSQIMQTLMDDKKGIDQTKIDNIFQETPLSFGDYRETEDGYRTERLRKYIHVKTLEEFAFKIVENEYITQVKNQVTILKKLKDCQNIIRFYGLTNNGSFNFLVTEWAENKNLREYISEHGQNIEIQLRLRFAYDIAKGLNFLNSVKIYHRDIRSENIVITDHDVAKITNFKLSRGINTVTGNLTVNKESVRYCAPEMLRRGINGEVENTKNRCNKCEVYSFGILLWEIAECKIPYQQFEDFLELIVEVVNGYREKFTLDIGIPERYQSLVNKSISQNPGSRPTFSKMLIELQDIFKNYKLQIKSYTSEPPISRSHFLNSNKITLPVRKMTSSTIAAAAEDYAINYMASELSTNCYNKSPSKRPVQKIASSTTDYAIDFESFNFISIEKAIEEHKNNWTDKKRLYKCFDAYANLGNPRAKYWKAYYISKGWSNIESQEEQEKISAELYKEAADYDDEIPDAQFRYAKMAMHGKGVKQNMEEAIKYFLKAAKNDHVVAMFNIATYYFAIGNEELGNYYIIKAANKGYEQAIKYCNKKGISHS